MATNNPPKGPPETPKRKFRVPNLKDLRLRELDKEFEKHEKALKNLLKRTMKKPGSKT